MALTREPYVCIVLHISVSVIGQKPEVGLNRNVFLNDCTHCYAHRNSEKAPEAEMPAVVQYVIWLRHFLKLSYITPVHD